MTSHQFTCHICGENHEGIPFSLAADFPDNLANLSMEDRASRAVIGSDQCIIDEKWFFIRGCADVPVTGHDESVVWGLWALVTKEVFDKISEAWEEEGREQRCGPFKGRLANELAAYPGSFNLKLSIHIQPVGIRPLFTLEEPDHAMTQDQRHGILPTVAYQTVTSYLHDPQRPVS